MRGILLSGYTKKTTPNEEGSELGLFVFLAGVIALLSLFAATKFSFSYVKNIKYFEQSRATQGVLIERVRIPRDRNAPLFYLRYKYENEAARENCSVDIETKLTPRDQACVVTIDRIQVNEEAYYAAKIPSKIDLVYLPSREKSWSQVEGHTSRHTRSMVGAILSFLASLLLGGFTLRAIRLL